jgi:hypothetical protein
VQRPCDWAETRASWECDDGFSMEVEVRRGDQREGEEVQEEGAGWEDF